MSGFSVHSSNKLGVLSHISISLASQNLRRSCDTSHIPVGHVFPKIAPSPDSTINIILVIIIVIIIARVADQAIKGVCFCANRTRKCHQYRLTTIIRNEPKRDFGSIWAVGLPVCPPVRLPSLACTRARRKPRPRRRPSRLF